MNNRFQLEDKMYHLFITDAQIASIRSLNSRSKTPWVISERMCDVADFVSNDDPRADMITGLWFGMTIGILPDGSCHS